MRTILLMFFSLLLGLQQLASQTVVNATLQEDFSRTLLNFILPVPATYGIRTYRITYETLNPFGQPVVASGMLAIPYGESATTDYAFPLAVYMHGTAGNPQAVPSRVGVGERVLVNVLATNGYITLAPDYLGLGDDATGLHPYVHAATEASAGRDMLLAVRTWLAEQNIGFTNQLFLTGYSQGGHASMALHRDLQLNPGTDELVVTAAAHLSGPYSISEVMAATLFDDQGTTLPAYIAYTYLSYNYIYGLYDDITAIFKPPYLAAMQAFQSGAQNLDQTNATLFALLDQEGGRLRDMMQDSILTILREQPEHPINQALQDNDVYDWAPQAPTLLVYCTLDEQVPFQNAILADSVMRANGSTTVQLFNGGERDHGGCVQPAVTIALLTFGSFAEVVTSSKEWASPYQSLITFPNPLAAGEPLRFQEGLAADMPFQLFHSSGQLISSGLALQGSQKIQLPTLAPGFYTLRGRLAGQLYHSKFIVR